MLRLAALDGIAVGRKHVRSLIRREALYHTGLLKQHRIALSLDGTGYWRDNVFVERLWKSARQSLRPVAACGKWRLVSVYGSRRDSDKATNHINQYAQRGWFKWA